ncbi:MAG: SCO family protein [Thermoflexales bacterium]|nr:SCO family protein [Thermoflexales bacterium]MCS7324000.1 SCO family protein [Thermoflexales bacterium]MCX7939422.1 SCO family protein [Thermoflexales bacterium]MDW8052940.1 SCO family protein [Anaerolineae bacterium]MDW8291591.1 SCO family protein [Anaerolineae bacterium]
MTRVGEVELVAGGKPAGGFRRVLAASGLIGFGAVMLFFGAVYLQDLQLLAEAPEALWAFICGAPLAEEMGPALMFIAGALGVLVALALLWVGGTKERQLFSLALLVCVATIAGAGYLYGQANREAHASATDNIAYVDPPRLMPDFTLTSDAGTPLRLSDLRGRFVVMFFGYTHCPDVCPLSLYEMRRVKQALGEDAAKVQFVFVSVDGKRDTPERLRAYVRSFDSAFIGLTGPEQEVRLIALEYGARFRANPPNADGFYTVDHSADTYVIDPQGYWRMMWGLNAKTEDVVKALRALVRQGT